MQRIRPAHQSGRNEITTMYTCINLKTLINGFIKSTRILRVISLTAKFILWRVTSLLTSLWCKYENRISLSHFYFTKRDFIQTWITKQINMAVFRVYDYKLQKWQHQHTWYTEHCALTFQYKRRRPNIVHGFSYP